MLRGKREKAKGGKFLGGMAPFGYTWNENTKQYEIIEAEAEVIRLIFNLCIQGLSVKKIRDHLNALGHDTPLKLRGCKSNGKANGKWATSTITKILTSSKYIGEFERWRQKLVDRNVRVLRPEEEWITSEILPIITKEVFELAQECLQSRKVLSKRNSKRDYLLGGLLYCEFCGCKMTGECHTYTRKNGVEYRYYYCFNSRHKHLNKDCPIKNAIANDIENAVWEEIKKLLKSPTLLKQAILQSEAIDSSEDNLKELTRLLDDKATEEERLLDLYQIGKFDVEKLNSRMEKLRREKEAISKNVEALRERNKLDTRLKTLNELRLELEADIDSFDFEKKRKVLKILLWGKPGVGVFLKPKCSVEIRGLVDFTKLNGIDKIDRAIGIENISSLLQEH